MKHEFDIAIIAGNPSYGPQADSLYVFTSLLQDYLVLPCIVASVWRQYGYLNEIAYAYAFVSFLPIITQITEDTDVNKDLFDTMVAFNCLTLGTLSLIYQNYFGIAACVSYAFTHFVIKNDHETYFAINSQDLYNYAMCFFAFFSLKTVLD